MATNFEDQLQQEHLAICDSCLALRALCPNTDEYIAQLDLLESAIRCWREGAINDTMSVNAENEASSLTTGQSSTTIVMAAQPGLLLTVASKASELGLVSVPEGHNSAPAKDHPGSPGWNEWNAYMGDDLYTPTGSPGADANGAAFPPIPSNKATDIEHGVVGVNDKPADSSFTAPQATATNAPILPNNQAVCTDHTVLGSKDGLEAGIDRVACPPDPSCETDDEGQSVVGLNNKPADSSLSEALSNLSYETDDEEESVVGSNDKSVDSSLAIREPVSIILQPQGVLAVKQQTQSIARQGPELPPSKVLAVKRTKTRAW